MRTRTIELVEKVISETEVTLIAECNEYDENQNVTNHLSRSEFTFPIEMTDSEIISSLQTNEYSIYFVNFIG